MDNLPTYDEFLEQSGLTEEQFDEACKIAPSFSPIYGPSPLESGRVLYQRYIDTIKRMRG